MLNTNQSENQSGLDMKTTSNNRDNTNNRANNREIKDEKSKDFNRKSFGKSVGKIFESFGMRSFGLLIAGLVILLDQGSKWLVTETFEYGETLAVFQSFALTLRYNTGAAFSLLAEASGWQRWFFVAIAAIVSSIIFVWLGRLSKNNKTEALGLALILGGALGNVIDRLFHGYVVDFILVYYKEWQFPAFNIADAAINLGVFFVILSMFKRKA